MKPEVQRRSGVLLGVVLGVLLGVVLGVLLGVVLGVLLGVVVDPAVLGETALSAQCYLRAVAVLAPRCGFPGDSNGVIKPPLRAASGRGGLPFWVPSDAADNSPLGEPVARGRG